MPDLKVGIDARGAQTGSRAAVRSIDSIRNAAGKLNPGLRQVGQSFKDVQVGAGGLARVLQPLFAVLSVGTLVRVADGYSEMNNRLKLVTSSTEQLTAVNARLLTQANDARVGLGSQVELFSRIARASSSLGVSQQDVLGVTEAISKAITVSGASATEANAAIIQLGQGLASGTLRGEELNSVLEQAPRLARAIADGLGVSIGELRELGSEGKLTNRAVFQAIASQAQVINQEFGKLAPTVSQGFTVLGNSLTSVIGQLDQASSLSSSFAQSLIDVSEKVAPAIITAFGSIQAAGVSLVSTVDEVGLRIQKFNADFRQNAKSLSDTGAFGLTGLLSNFFNSEDLGAEQNAIAREIQAIREGREKTFADIAKRVQDELARLRNPAEGVDLSEVVIDPDELLRQVSKLKGDFQQAADKIDAELRKTARREAEAEAAALSKIFENTRTPLEAYKQSLAELHQRQSSLGDDTFTRAVGQAAGDFLDARSAVETFADRVILLRETLSSDQFSAALATQLGEAFIDAQTPVEQFTDKLRDLQAIQNELGSETFSRLAGQLGEDFLGAAGSADQLNDRLRVLKSTLSSVSFAEAIGPEVARIIDETRTPLETFNLELDRLRLLQEQLGTDTFSRAVADLSVEFYNAAGGAEEVVAQLDSLRESLGEDTYAASIAKVVELEEKTKKVFSATEEFAIQAARNIQSSFADFLFDPFEEGLDGLARSFADTLKRMAAELLSQQLLKSLFSAGAGLGGGFGQLFGGLASSLAPGAASGGSRGPGVVPVGEFGRELVAMPSRGVVMNNNATNALGAGGSMGGNLSIDIQTSGGEKATIDVLDTAEGERKIMAILERNPGQVKQRLGLPT